MVWCRWGEVEDLGGPPAPQTFQLLFHSPLMGFPKDLGSVEEGVPPLFYTQDPNYKVQNVQGGAGGLVGWGCWGDVCSSLVEK